jgi:hypothetical protein
MALLTNSSAGGKGGGYNKLIEKCGPDVSPEKMLCLLLTKKNILNIIPSCLFD